MYSKFSQSYYQIAHVEFTKIIESCGVEKGWCNYVQPRVQQHICHKLYVLEKGGYTVPTKTNALLCVYV